jgi:hypothetical protein
MNKIYTLKSALISSASRVKCDAIAAPASADEIRQNRSWFDFDFQKLRTDYVVYKLCVHHQLEEIQGLVGFRPTPGILECANMEISRFNKRGRPQYTGIGKALIALCCKVSEDEGMGGYIYFDAKNRLIPYYERVGARSIFGLRMVIEPHAARTLIDLYF